MSTNRNNQHSMSTPATEVLVPVALFAMTFGIVYILATARHRQRMAMIDKGMDPGGLRDREVPMRGLRNGLFMIGLGLGLFFGYIMDINMPSNGLDGDMGDSPLPYFIMVLLFGGLALVTHHLIVRRKQQG
jgi:hypothetical protein